MAISSHKRRQNLSGDELDRISSDFDSNRHRRPLSAEERHEVLPGFEHVNRYWDTHAQRVAAKIQPGEYYVTQSNQVIVTVLGSCVSACIRDTVTGIGGMNHFMLPDGDKASLSVHPSDPSAATRYGNVAMEHLINSILSHGGLRGQLEVKILGGGQVIKGMTDVGKRNIEFVREYIEEESIKLLGEDVGGKLPRKVYYHPKSGIVRCKHLKKTANDTLYVRENSYHDEINVAPVGGDIELF